MARPSRISARGGRLIRAIVVRPVACAILLLPSYALLAYVLLPASWHGFQKLQPADAVGVAYTAEAIPADPLNVALVGSRDEVVMAMRAAGWLPADRITLRSGWRDARSVLFDRSYPTAPVSTHYLRGRPQDLAFERQVGRSPRRRHHVRLWRVGDPKAPEMTLWIGDASFDESVGVSRYTGEVMHHIHPAVDREREQLLRDLEAAGAVSRVTRLDGFRPNGEGFNGGGDRYFTDGSLGIAIVRRPVRYRPSGVEERSPDRS
jgi:hypothetical protein